jgi:hypothetical protein
MTAQSTLSGKSRGTALEERGGGIGAPSGIGARGHYSSTSFADLPPPPGEDFGRVAVKLAGAAALMFGWAPETFWNATPAELGALIDPLKSEAGLPLADAEMARLKELFPDG